MVNAVRFTVSLEQALLEEFDRLCDVRGYATRSEAIRDLIRDHRVVDQWAANQEAMGTITLVFDHHAKDLSDKLTAIQHDRHELILSTMHLHLDQDNCLEVIAVKGPGTDIQALADSLISLKGVKHGKLTVTSAGRELG